MLIRKECWIERNKKRYWTGFKTTSNEAPKCLSRSVDEGYQSLLFWIQLVEIVAVGRAQIDVKYLAGFIVLELVRKCGRFLAMGDVTIHVCSRADASLTIGV